MANPEHLAIIEQGVEVWNKWREENPEVRPDLSNTELRSAGPFLLKLIGKDLNGANLRKAIIRGSHLIRAELCGADLSGADLRSSDLSESNFYRANLHQANLQSASLRSACFQESILNGVNFIDADLGFANLVASSLLEASLSGANLIGANLSKATLRGVVIGNTAFGNVDLSNVDGLDTVIHLAPSTIGIDTLYKSKGNIPEIFLRGCGVPDQMIEYAKSLTGSPIEYYSCFISYSHKDEEFAKWLWDGLQAKNVRCWYAPHDMKIGDKIRPTIDDSIRIHDKLLLIFSKHSIKSKWVKHEVENALDLEIEREKTVLFPVRVDDCVMGSEAGWANEIKKTRHIGDFTKWKDHDAYSEAFERLLRDLKAG